MMAGPVNETLGGEKQCVARPLTSSNGVAAAFGRRGAGVGDGWRIDVMARRMWLIHSFISAGVSVAK